MDLDMRNALLAYHAITGCDSTSALSGHIKKSSWPVFKKHFKFLNDFGCYHLSDEQLEKAEAFVMQMYLFKKPVFKHICNIDDLKAAMFQHVKELDKLPPSRHVLSHHLHRANYQTFCCNTADIAMQSLLLPINSGWEMQDEQPISLKDLELISCSCKTGCRTSRCGCAERKQKCMEDDCHIGMECFNQYNYCESQDDTESL